MTKPREPISKLDRAEQLDRVFIGHSSLHERILATALRFGESGNSETISSRVSEFARLQHEPTGPTSSTSPVATPLNSGRRAATNWPIPPSICAAIPPHLVRDGSAPMFTGRYIKMRF